ncbi:MAG: 50S ribosomal protein L21e [Nanoarchaeota archaeon]|nr:50S ribosomal protein L21e [DPANN group archaeon]MBL7117139.1 50S ribosomal protein L21e [Nanoarchaeota archaeon]
MVKRVGSRMRKSRQKLSKSIREKSKIRISSFLQKFNPGDRVALKAEPAYQKGQYFLRFHGKTGTVTGQRGKCYEVKIKDFKKEKTLVVHPIHLKKVS